MSIILRALKRVQDQKATVPPDVSDAGTEKEEGAASDIDGSPASIPAAGDKGGGFDAAPVGMGEMLEDSRRHAPSRDAMTRHRFGFGPKALLGLMVVLGVFTTGWFTNKIYISLKRAENTRLTESHADAAQPVRHTEATQVVPAQRELANPVSPQKPPRQTAGMTPSAESVPVASELVVPAPSQIPAPSTVGMTPYTEDAAAPADVPSPRLVRESAVKEPSQPVTPLVAQSSSVRAQAPMGETRKEAESEPVKKGRPELKINAIAWKAQEPKAIVNMQRVYVGEMIEGATVLAIQRKSILFEYDGESFEVRF